MQWTTRFGSFSPPIIFQFSISLTMFRWFLFPILPAAK
jgi:hypothetical protein